MNLLKKWLRPFSMALGLFAIGFGVVSWTAADKFIAPVPSHVTWPSDAPYSPESVTFSATDGTVLKGWFLPQDKSTSAVILLHGVRANRDAMLQRALWLHSLGYNVFLYDARGCGESAPVVRSFGSHETKDLMGALGWLQSHGITRIGCIGCSQGAATILLASSELPPAVCAVVAEAPYATLRDTVDDHFRGSTGLPSCYFGLLAVPIAEWKLKLNMDDVSPLHEMPQLKAPLYLIGGTADTLAPVAGLRKLLAAATGEKTLWLIEWAGHADFFSYAEDQYKQRIGDFLRSHL
jgi:pimeloyl-ACP methyl ester carboxylesterase